MRAPRLTWLAPLTALQRVHVCVGGHAIAGIRHRLTAMLRQGRIPDMAPFFSRYGVANEKKKKPCRSGWWGEIPSQIKQSISCGWGGPV
jgi:hypothetical protein